MHQVMQEEVNMGSIESIISEKKEPIHKRILSALSANRKPAVRRQGGTNKLSKKKTTKNQATKTGFAQAKRPGKYLADELLKLVLFFSITGILISAYTLLMQYNTSARGLCTNCFTVLKSQYALLLGIPVSIITTAGFILFSVLSFSMLTRRDRPKLYPFLTQRHALLALIILAIAGALLAAYYTWVQGSALGVWCIMCIALSLLVLAILILLLIINHKNSH